MNEKRQHYRINFASKRQGKVEFLLDNNQNIHGRLIDLSAGGLRCQISHRLSSLFKPHQFIERINVYPRIVGRPLCVSGIVSRVKCASKNRPLDCAIEFSAIYSGFEMVDEEKVKALQNFKDRQQIRGHNNFIARLQGSVTPKNSRFGHQRHQKREKLHASFHDISEQLPIEERWWFHCVLDSLKNSGPQYQKGLLAEYIKLCKKSLQP